MSDERSYSPVKRALLYNLLLAAIWMAVTSDFTEANLVFGLVIGYLVLLLAQPLVGSAGYGRRLWFFLRLVARFLWELILSSLRVAAVVLRPRLRVKPGIIAVPLDVTTDDQITALANLVTLTPGTLSIDVSDDRRTLYIHAMSIAGEDVEAKRREIKQTLERRVFEAFEGHRGAPSAEQA